VRQPSASDSTSTDPSTTSALHLQHYNPTHLFKTLSTRVTERDIWLLHLTGEEFPADCLGSRYFAQSLIEKTLKIRLKAENWLIFPGADSRSICHRYDRPNRDGQMDIFEISPGKDQKSLQLAWQAHLANSHWNRKTRDWNQHQGRENLGRGRRSAEVLKLQRCGVFQSTGDGTSCR